MPSRYTRTRRCFLQDTAFAVASAALAAHAQPPPMQPQTPDREPPVGRGMQVGNIVLGLHGGTSGPPHEVSPELRNAQRTDLEHALRAGHAALQRPGATSLDAVEAAVRVLEDSPHFNAGRGSVFTHEGKNELDASIMEGAGLRAGGVAGVTVIKNPITAARAVMEKTPHVLLMGDGAEALAREQGLEIVEPSYFWTERRWKQLQEALRRAGQTDKLMQHTEAAEPTREWSTVGAVAVDAQGNLAAGTSTGGMNNKRHGRVGDSPIIGAGTFADNGTCAVSCTGAGEFFIRLCVAHSVAMLVKYQGRSVAEAADEVVHKQLSALKGDGGLIALDARGNFATAFNTPGLHRGWITRDGQPTVIP